ncbi:MAG TPA: hypothetical protein IGS17_16260 [Oscillatoriales cyanobacterium M59_W2019_021]|nr:MAG: hypothetical protein D6728_17020 [Cyanobacteria bacterium J055]HIK31775.1 hypothetical protein [Oscillatoriales cyanobacterium M4454_W2019_049]HIK52458.1 hypothetical protein [Oscillatoriales cyanobacterium M59_W2019_021]
MWSCPRSRSTLIARSFGQLEGGIVYDEPLYAPYLVQNGFDHPQREAVLASRETDYDRAISLLVGDLPDGASFSFQKHISKHFRSNQEREWLKYLSHFFLIRHPQEIIHSYQKICDQVTEADIGFESLFDIFKTVESFLGKPPLVVDANDLVRNPRLYLERICLELGIPFSETMLSWDVGLSGMEDRSHNPFPWLWTGELPMTNWYSQVNRTTGFVFPKETLKIELPPSLIPVCEACLPFYEKLSQYRLRIDNAV